MLATLNSKQIVDEIVKDTTRDNDPHDVIAISPDIVLASRPTKDAPMLSPDTASRQEPRINLITEPPASAPSVDTAVRVAASDLHVPRRSSSLGKWLRGAFVTVLFAVGSAAATVAWQAHRDTAKAMIAAWMPALVALPSEATSPAPAEPASTEPQAAATDQAAEQPATPAPAQAQDNGSTAAAAPATATDGAQSLQSVTRDLAAMTQQIEQLKANIAELKAGQEQMAREMAKATQPKPAEAKVVDPRARLSALPPRPAAPPPVRKPKPVYTPAHAPTYVPAPIAPPPPSQAVVAPPPPAPPAATTSQVADDDGPVVRPPMPVH